MCNTSLRDFYCHSQKNHPEVQLCLPCEAHDSQSAVASFITSRAW